jgi:hypothetical protein
MCKPMFALLALTISLFGTQCWASTCSGGGEGGVACTNTFIPTDTTGTYNFGSDGQLIVHFDKVLSPGFSLTVTVVHPSDALLQSELDPNVFPNTTCFHYLSSGSCTQYNFTCTAGCQNIVPQKNRNYTGLITLTLTYSSGDVAQDPAFGHAPGESTTFSEDILTGYFQPTPEDPVMIGKTPGLSSVIALNKKLEETDCFVWVSPTKDGQIFTVGQEIEVEFQLFNGTCPGTGDPIRDKDARLSFFTFDSITGQPVFVPVGKDEGGKHFHFDHDEGVNEREVDTEGLQPGTYYITVFSTEFSPQTRRVQIQ